MSYYEKTLSTEIKFRGNIITVRQDMVELPNGKTASRDVVEHPGGVGIVAFTDEGKLLMVRQFRKPVEQELWEIPAGKLSPGEEPISCGKRELEEETGYIAKEIVPLGEFFPTPGFCNETHYLFYAPRLAKGSVNLDEDEFLHAKAFTTEEVMQMIILGEVVDSKTILGLFLAKEKWQEGLITKPISL